MTSSSHQTPVIFQYISDIHLECMDRYIDYSKIIRPAKGCSNLILAGDIGRVFYQTCWRGTNTVHYRAFIEYCASHWNRVFLVIGNHEAYSKSIIDTRKRVREICSQYPNVHYMENETFELPDLGLHVAGCTLWSNMSESTLQAMGDRSIKLVSKRINSTAIREWHRESAQFINDLPQLPNGQKWILITHHCPFLPWQSEAVDKRRLTDDGYYSHMDLDSSKISHAVFGHNHIQTDEIINGVHYLSNPFGYPDEKKVRSTFNEYKVFTI